MVLFAIPKLSSNLSISTLCCLTTLVMPCSLKAMLCLVAGLIANVSLAKDWESPPYNFLYQFPMPLAPVKKPLKSFTFANGPPIDYFEVDIKPFEQQIYPNLGKTRLVGYDGSAPGPTFEMERGREAVVRFINHADRENSCTYSLSELRTQSSSALECATAYTSTCSPSTSHHVYTIKSTLLPVHKNIS